MYMYIYICIICYDTSPGSKYVMIFHVSIHIQMMILIVFYRFTGVEVTKQKIIYQSLIINFFKCKIPSPSFDEGTFTSRKPACLNLFDGKNKT